MSEFESGLSGLLNDPEELGKAVEMAKSLLDGGLGDKLSGLFGTGEESSGVRERSADSDMLSGIAKMMSAMSDTGDKTALLEAIKPYLAENRRSKLDRAARITRIARLAGAAFSEQGGAGDGV